MRLSQWAFSGLLAVVVGLTGLCDRAEASSRALKKFGLGYGLLSEPSPSATGFSAKYNFKPWLQFAGGYGSIGGVAKTFGASAKGFVIPSWNFSPYVGLSYGITSLSGEFELASKSIGGVDSLKTLSALFGLDWQTNFGLNLGIDVSYFVSAPELKDAGISVLPGFHIGWFF